MKQFFFGSQRLGLLRILLSETTDEFHREIRWEEFLPIDSPKRVDTFSIWENGETARCVRELAESFKAHAIERGLLYKPITSDGPSPDPLRLKSSRSFGSLLVTRQMLGIQSLSVFSTVRAGIMSRVGYALEALCEWYSTQVSVPFHRKPETAYELSKHFTPEIVVILLDAGTRKALVVSSSIWLADGALAQMVGQKKSELMPLRWLEREKLYADELSNLKLPAEFLLYKYRATKRIFLSFTSSIIQLISFLVRVLDTVRVALSNLHRIPMFIQRRLRPQ